MSTGVSTSSKLHGLKEVNSKEGAVRLTGNSNARGTESPATLYFLIMLQLDKFVRLKVLIGE